MKHICKIVILLSFMTYGGTPYVYAQTLSTGNRTTTVNKSSSTKDIDLKQYENVTPMELPTAPDIKTPEIKQVIKEEETAENASQFSGLYKSPSESSTRLYSDVLARHCGLDASTVAASEDGKELHNCVNKIVREINDTDSTIKAKGFKDLNTMRYDELKGAFSSSIDTKIKNANHSQEQENLGNSNTNTMTEIDDQVVASDAIAGFIHSMADITDTYSDNLRGLLVKEFNKINPTVLKDMEEENKEEEKEEENKEEENPNPYNVDYFDRTVIYTQENPYVSPFVWIENNMCRRNICLTPKDVEVKTVEDLSCTPQDAECPDGDYATSDPNIIMFCYSHYCTPIDKSRRDQLEGGISEIKYKQGDKCEVTRVNQGSSNTKIEICPDGDYEVDGACIRCTAGECMNVTCGSEDGSEHGGDEFHVDYLGNNKCLYKDVEIKCPNGGPYMTKDGSACYSCQDRGCDEVNCETGDIIMKEGVYLGNCQCVVDGVSSVCQDGIYLNNKELTESCVSGQVSDPDTKVGFKGGKAVVTVGSQSYALTPEQYLDYIKTGKLASDINWQAAEVETPTNEKKGFVGKVDNIAGKVLTWGNNAANSLLGRNKKKKKDKNEEATSEDSKQ